MRYLRLPAALILAGTFLISANNSWAQQNPRFSKSSHGTLTAQVTVESSVAVVQDEDGREHLVVANGPGAADYSSPAKRVQLKPFRSLPQTPAQKKTIGPKPASR